MSDSARMAAEAVGLRCEVERLRHDLAVKTGEAAALWQANEDLRHALAWALVRIQDDPPMSGEARENYTGATRLAWPDSPENWEPE